MTSSFTQSVSRASRASSAVRTASLAVKQPAVLGSTRIPWSTSSWNSEPVSAVEYRRMATVVRAVPEASSAAPRPSRLGAPPVPMMSRDPRATPSITRASAAPGFPAGLMVLVSVMASASLYCSDKFNIVALGERGGEPLAPRHHLGIMCDGDAQFTAVRCLSVGCQRASGDLADERGDGGAVGHLVRVSVQGDVHAVSLMWGVVAAAAGRENRSGLKGDQRESDVPSSSAVQMAAAAGVSRTPCRKNPVA